MLTFAKRLPNMLFYLEWQLIFTIHRLFSFINNLNLPDALFVYMTCNLEHSCTTLPQRWASPPGRPERNTRGNMAAVCCSYAENESGQTKCSDNSNKWEIKPLRYSNLILCTASRILSRLTVAKWKEPLQTGPVLESSSPVQFLHGRY